MPVRTRFSPSPTGELHLGGARTALYAWLHAQHHRRSGDGGVFAIRIEDTDRARFVPGAQERLLATLRALGMTWDEGPDVGGSYGPYVQSERLDRYRTAASRLVEQGSAYRCDCSPERLQELRDAQSAAKQPTRYDGHCRTRTDVNAAQPHVIRFRTPEEGSVTANDRIHGAVTVACATIDDFVLLKSDGYPTYHLAHVVDDHDMAMTDVIRGDEWLPSLPRHLLLFRAFGWDPPAYAHLPLLHSTQHKKLSKRDGDVSVESFLAWCLPSALVNFIALLGWNPTADRECYTVDELIAAFDIAGVNRSPAVVDLQKLEWMNGEYIRQLAPSELLAEIHARTGYFARIGSGVEFDLFPGRPENRVSTESEVLRMIALEQPRMHRLDQFPLWYGTSVRTAPLEWKTTDRETTRANLAMLLERIQRLDVWDASTTPAELESAIKSWIAEGGRGVGETLWPMRVALSGEKASPSPFELAWVFGKEETLRRIRHAIQELS